METDELRKQWQNVMHRFGRLNHSVPFDGLSRREYMALEFLHGHGQPEEGQALSVSDLAGCLRVSSPAVSRMLRGLEEKSFIERRIDPADRRNTHVYLTVAGEHYRQQASQQMFDFFNGVIEEMGIEQMEQLLTLWECLAETMEKEMTKIMMSKGEGEC